MKSERRKESVIHDKADLPSGYVPMGTLASGSGSTPLYTYMQRAWERGEWSRSLFKCRGKRFIHQDDLNRLTAEFNSRRSTGLCEQETEPDSGLVNRRCDSSTQLEALLCALSAMVTNQTTTLHAIERIADAVERIAKHPLARLEDVGIVETEASWQVVSGQSH